VTTVEAVLGVLTGLGAGVLAGLFGVGGGIVATPAIAALLGAPPIVAVATPLPVIFPTAIVAAEAYRRAGQVDVRAAVWMSIPGAMAAAGGAALTRVVDGDWLLLATAALLVWQASEVARGSSASEAEEEREISPWLYSAVGGAAGFVSGLLGIGGGIVMVPLLAGVLGMPLKRALGTSLATIVALVIPGTLVHAALGNIDWAIVLVLVAGSVVGARLGAGIALGARERTLRLVVGGFLLTVGLVYGVSEIVTLAGGGTAAG
jgi:uncharacterized protein